jgi:hypothetical protein
MIVYKSSQHFRYYAVKISFVNPVGNADIKLHIFLMAGEP